MIGIRSVAITASARFAIANDARDFSPSMSGICTSMIASSNGFVLERIERFAPRGGDLHGVTVLLEQPGREPLIDDVVLDQQDTQRIGPSVRHGTGAPAPPLHPLRAAAAPTFEVK